MSEKKYDTSFAGVQYQILATVVANLCCLTHGCAIGWMSTTLPLLRSVASPLADGAISVETAAWIGSAVSLGGITGTLAFGLLTNFIGSKRSMFFCVFPLAAHWLIVYWALSAWLLIVARALSGFAAGGIFLCIPLFVSEISHEQIRGQLGSLLMLNFNVGIVAGYALSSSLSYSAMPLIMMALPILFLLIFTWLPSTPQFLLKCDRRSEAESALRFYRNITARFNAIDEAKEASLKAELERLTLIARQNKDQQPLEAKDFCNLALLIGPTLLACSQFSGTFTLCNYASTIFSASGTQIDPDRSSLIMGSLQVVGTVCSWSLIDRVGRRVLLLVSSAGGAVALLVTATYSWAAERHEAAFDVTAWQALPVVSLSFFIFISSIGMTSVPYVVVTEVLPAPIRRIGTTLCICSVSVFSFVMLRYFPVMLARFELSGCMWFMASAGVVAFVFTAVAVPETRGKNLHQLEAAEAVEPAASVKL